MFTSSNFNLYLEDFEWLKFKKFTYKSGSFTLHFPPFLIHVFFLNEGLWWLISSVNLPGPQLPDI